MQEAEIIREFLVESSENLSRLDREMVELEQRPKDAQLLASIFRTLHTIKGTCGFLAFGTLETITHHAENILGQVRGGQRELTPELVSIILETVDAVKAELTSIEETGKESGTQYEDLVERQKSIAANVQSSLAQVQPLQEAAPDVSSAPSVAEEPGTAPQPQAIAVSDTPVASTPQAPQQGPPVKANDFGRRRTDVPSGSAAESTIRVDVALLNKLMNLVGELVLARNQILQFNAKYEDAALNTTAQKLNLITTELQEGVMRTRMQPIGIIWGNLPRVVRDLATSQGKQIELQMDGSETELDKTIIEAIKDPLTHIVRNACDHGIETPELRGRAQKHAQGKLTLSAFHEGGNVNIEICDDGAGVHPQHIKQTAIDKGLIKPEKADRMSDRELANLVFLPGFSTAKQISNISGRGVGMDVVKTNIERIGGTVDIASRPGHGTTVKIKIPLTLAIVPGLVVSSANERFVIPQASLLELVWLEGEKAKTQIELINGTPVYRRRDHLLPLVRLSEVLQLNSNASPVSDAVNIIILQAEERQFGLIVDGISDTQEIVVKPLGGLLKSIKVYAGATIMGDGKISLILDVPGIARRCGLLGDSRQAATLEDTRRKTPVEEERRELLLFRAGSFERLAVPLALVARLEEISSARIERVADGLVVQYRDQILPLVPLASRLGCAWSETSLPDSVCVIVFTNGERRVGLLVDAIIDIVEESVTVKRASDHSYLLGSAVIGGRITELLDMHSVINGYVQKNSYAHSDESRATTILLTEESSFSRSLVRSYLEIGGHHVIEAADCNEAMEKLSKVPVDIVMTALDLPNRGAFELLASIKRHFPDATPPVVALSPRQNASADGFSECFFKFDRLEISRSLERLGKAIAPDVCLELMEGGK